MTDQLKKFHEWLCESIEDKDKPVDQRIAYSRVLDKFEQLGLDRS
jgi:hypothetical protein